MTFKFYELNFLCKENAKTQNILSCHVVKKDECDRKNEEDTYELLVKYGRHFIAVSNLMSQNLYRPLLSIFKFSRCTT